MTGRDDRFCLIICFSRKRKNIKRSTQRPSGLLFWFKSFTEAFEDRMTSGLKEC